MVDIRSGDRQLLTARFWDDRKKAAPVDGVPTWQVSSPEFTIVVAEDGMTAWLHASGNLIGAIGVVTLTGDADLGQGLRPVTKEESFRIVSGTAAEAEIELGETLPIAP